MDPRHPGRRQLPEPKLPPVPLGWKLWAVFCGAVGLGVLGVAVWAVIKLVNHFTA